MGFTERLRGPDLVLSSWSTIPDPIVAEALARDGWDACTIDLQHGMIGYAEARGLVMTISALGKPVIVRLPLDGASIGARMLDLGVNGVIAPMINTAEDAEAFVAAMQFPPRGRRSWGAYRAVASGGYDRLDYLHEANGRLALFAMVETREAVDNLEAIARTPGLTGLFVGPSELTISMTNGRGFEPDREPEVMEAMDRVVAIASENGLCPGIFTPNTAQAAARIERGFRFVTVGSDMSFIAASSAQALQALRRS